MWYIEKLLRDIESSLNENENIYTEIEIDLTKEQIKSIKEQIEDMYMCLTEVKSSFDIETKPSKLSRIIEVNTDFIWETIEETWSSKMEKTSGKIGSLDKKRLIDENLNKILGMTNKIKKLLKNEDR